MQLSDFLFFLVVVVVLGIWTVAEERRALELGYEIGRLEQQRAALMDQRQELRYQRAMGASPERLEQLAREYALPLHPPGQPTRLATEPRRRPAPGPLGDPGLLIARRGRD